MESEAQAEIQGEQTLMKECGEEKQVEVHAEVQVSEVETEKQAQVQTGQLEDEQAEHAVAESLQLELTTVQVEPEVPDHSVSACMYLVMQHIIFLAIYMEFPRSQSAKKNRWIPVKQLMSLIRLRN